MTRRQVHPISDTVRAGEAAYQHARRNHGEITPELRSAHAVYVREWKTHRDPAGSQPQAAE